MDPTQVPSGSTEPRTVDTDPTRSDLRNEMRPKWQKNKITATEVTQTQRSPLLMVRIGTSIQDQTNTLVWNQLGERQFVDDTPS